MPQIDPVRVLADLNRLREFGAFKTGVHRPTFSMEHTAALTWFAGRCADAGLDPVIDGIGNLLASSAARGPRLLAGSHIESQNEAGWLDGALGCIYALEAARVLAREPSTADIAVDVVAFADEEGHFGSFLGSRSLAGDVDEEELDEAVDRTRGTSLRAALAAAGHAGKPRVVIEPQRYSAYLEAHIEQGDWLEANALGIGIVTSIVGIWQFRVIFEGVQNHAGTTRMAIRRDAGVAAMRFGAAVEGAMRAAAGERSVWTMGRLQFEPGAPSIIPGRAELLFQIRDASAAVMSRMEEALRELAHRHDLDGPCRVTVEAMRKVPMPAQMDERVQAAVERAAEQHAAGRHTRMPSGAAHDAQIMSRLMPAGMLFVPSIGGISHHWTENTSDADIVLGAQVFADALVEIARSLPDRARAAGAAVRQTGP